MYSGYAGEAIADMGSEISEETQQALMALLGDCSLPLTHRSTVEITTDPELATRALNVDPPYLPPDVNIDTFLSEITNEIDNGTTNYYSALTVNNTNSTVEGDTIVNNFSIFSPGVTYLQYLLVTELHTTDITITDNGTKYCFVDKEVVTDVTGSFNGSTCTLTLTVTKETVKVFEECP